MRGLRKESGRRIGLREEDDERRRGSTFLLPCQSMLLTKKWIREKLMSVKIDAARPGGTDISGDGSKAFAGEHSGLLEHSEWHIEKK